MQKQNQFDQASISVKKFRETGHYFHKKKVLEFVVAESFEMLEKKSLFDWKDE